MKYIGVGFIVCAWLVYAACGILGFLVSCKIIAIEWGLCGLTLAFVIAPITFAAAPWYAALAHDNWYPVLLCYGGLVPFFVLFGIGTLLTRDD